MTAAAAYVLHDLFVFFGFTHEVASRIGIFSVIPKETKFTFCSEHAFGRELRGC